MLYIVDANQIMTELLLCSGKLWQGTLETILKLRLDMSSSIRAAINSLQVELPEDH